MACECHQCFIDKNSHLTSMGDWPRHKITVMNLRNKNMGKAAMVFPLESYTLRMRNPGPQDALDTTTIMFFFGEGDSYLYFPLASWDGTASQSLYVKKIHTALGSFKGCSVYTPSLLVSSAPFEWCWYLHTNTTQIRITWMWPPPSNSDHQEYYIFNRESL